ncbi:MAG: hypothetical protein PHU45_05720, partial [Bacilli bacterium]|nr:hypothetical protein [Bacilli bacterium]
FLGWFDSNDNKITNFASITNDMILTAKYGADINKNGIADTDDKYYDVTFYDTVSRSNIIVDNVLIGMNANPPRTPSHADMVFSGWSRGFSNITGDITVNAVYRRINIEVVPTIYKVTFIDGITKETLGVVDVVEGLTANPPKTNIHSKKAFTNWDLSYENVKENLTITALYADDLNENQIDDSKEPHYTITFLASKNGTLEGTTEFENLLVGSDFDANIKIPKTTENKGYTFTGWNIELPEEGKKITKSVTYIANFEDKTAPSKVVINNSSNGNWTNETVNIDWESTDEGSGIAKYQYAYSENALDREFQDFSSNEKTQMSRSTERNSKIFIRAVDNVGNKSEATMTEIKIDKTLPKFNHKSGYHIDQDINIIITEQNLDKVVINNRDINKNTTYSESEITLSAEATYLVTAYDKAGNENSVWYAIDKTAPKIDVVNNTAEDSKHFVELNVYDKFLTSLSINDLQIDRKDFIVKGQNEEFYYNIKLTEDNIYKILAKDKFGHLTATEFVIDNSAPSKPVITARDNYKAGTWTKETVTLDFNSSDNNTNENNLKYVVNTYLTDDVNAWKSISNPAIYDKNVYNNVYVRAIDEAGNMSEPSSYFQVKVDKNNPKVPSINTNGYVSGTLTNKNIIVSASGSEETFANESPIIYQFRWNDEARWQDYDSVTIGSNYNAYISFRAKDEVGNVSEPTEKIHVRFDNSAPSKPVITARDNYKAGTWTKETVTLDFNSSDNNTNENNLKYVVNTYLTDDANAWKSISNPAIYDKNVYNNVYVRAIDEAGNMSEPSSYFQVKVDKNNPKVPSINTNGYVSGTLTNKNIIVSASGSEETFANESPIIYQFRWNDEARWQDYDSVTIGSNYNAYISFRAKDEVGNVSEPTEKIHVRFDNSAPSKPIITARDGYLAGTRTNKTVTLDFTTIDNNTSNENIIYQSTTSPGYTDSWKNISNPTIFDKDIYNNVYVRAIDEAGNISEHSNFFQVIVDKTAPTGEINYSERDTNGNVLVTLKTSEEIQEIAGWKKENATTYNKLYTKNEEETISFKDIAGNNGSIEVKITNINPRVTNISYSTTDPTNLLVTTTLTFSEPVFMPTPGLWLAEKVSNYTKWSTIYYNNIEENITFKNSYGKTNSEAISIKNFDRKLNDAKIEKTVAGDKKSVKVTLTADEEVIVYSNGWQKVDGQDGKVWEKTFTRNTFFGELISYRDVAGNYKLTYVTINEIKGSWTFQEPTTVETTEVAIESTTEELVTE